MSLAADETYDQNIVASLRRSRNPELAKTLRVARDRLTSRAGVSPRFDLELLDQHAAATRTAALAMPVPILLTGLGLSVYVGAIAALSWTAIASGCYLALLSIARHPQPDEAERESSGRRRSPLLGYAIAGVAWAYFAALSCGTCGPMHFELFQFSVLFLMMALTAMVSAALRGAVLVAFLPMMGVLVYQIATAGSPVVSTMHAMLICGVVFFAAAAEHLRRNAIERMKHQAEKDELIAELETARVISDEARRRAEEANLAKSRFLATMSHELRTPLNAILGFSEVISNEILGPIGNPTYKDYISDIHGSGQHLLALINEILDLSRVEAGRYGLNEEAVDLPAVARDCLSYVQLKTKAKGIAVKMQAEPALPQLWADERSIRQIILNLLSNAVKFTPAGGAITLQIGWTAGGGQYISVADNGPGIPENEIPVVLSSFGQGSIAIKSAEQGAGLGLPIVQALVAMHDGEFQLHSRLREGTQAIAIFPHARVLEIMPALQELA